MKKTKYNYDKEKKCIFDDLLKIIDIEENYTFVSSDIENDSDKKKKILALSDEIKKFYLSKDYRTLDRDNLKWISVVKFILRNNNYTLFKNDFKTSKGKDTKYVLVKDLEK